MPVRVKCRCGQELSLRYGEWVYFFIGLVLLCLVANTVALLLLYFRLEEMSAERQGPVVVAPSERIAPEESPAAGKGSAEEPGTPPAVPAQVKSSVSAPPPKAPDREREPDAGAEGRESRVDEGILLGEAVEEEPWPSPPWRERGSAPEAPRASVEAIRSPVEEEALVRLRMLELGRDDPLVAAGFLLDPDPRLRMLAADSLLARPDTGAVPAMPRTLASAALPELEGGTAEKLRSALDLGSGESTEDAAIREALQAFERSLEGPRQAPDVGALRGAVRESRARGVDIVLCIDATRSMEGLYHALDDDIAWLFPAIEWGIPDAQVGLVIFRDDVEGSRGFSRPGDVESAALLRTSRAEGGGDVPEGVHHALRHALSLGKFAWRKGSEKHVIVIGDAPPPYREQRSTLWLAGRAREEAGYRVHVLAPKLEDGKPEPFLAELAKRGGGTYTTIAEGGSPGEEVLACLLRGGSGPPLRPIAASLRGLFRLEPSRTRKEG